jgi:CRISPR-associated endonuclease/helicase Cas3
MAKAYYAHSAKLELGIPAQTYFSHISGVIADATQYANAAARYAKTYQGLMAYIPILAAEYHDFGKLATENQKILSSDSKKPLPIRHEDAGAYHLLRDKSALNAYAAWLVFSHHRGLDSLFKQKQRGTACFRADKKAEATLIDTEQNYEQYLTIHRQTIQNLLPNPPPIQVADSVFLRIALSCLVDADHGDTARFYQNESDNDFMPELLPEQRAMLLDQYVVKFAGSDPYKDRIYHACKQADTSPNLYNCDSPVGSGKTTAVMRHLLQAAIDKKLRRIFVILPFTNIIDQSVDIYRSCLILNEEDSEAVVAAHHHKADYQSPLSRQFAETWHSPIVVTTAVQFFETIASDAPSALRKLHNLTGSAIFIDESHASLPVHLWPPALKWLRVLSTEWGCHIVFASGSPVRFWEMEEFCLPTYMLPELIPETLRKEGKRREQHRIQYSSKAGEVTADELCDWVLESENVARLLILNTVQTAAVIAQMLRQRGEEVLHLSSALTPYDRKQQLRKVKQRLKKDAGSGWTLVATSVVEAGVDFSFDIGFRERAGLTSLIQTSGRINRVNNLTRDFVVWDFTLKKTENDDVLLHPAFKVSASVLNDLFRECGDDLDASMCSESILREIRQKNEADASQNKIIKADDRLDFSEVAKQFNVIDSDTRIVLVDAVLAERVKNYDFPLRKTIMEHSVQIWHYKLTEYAVTEINDSGIYRWDLAYDDFLGYMAGVLSTRDTLRSGCFWG